MAHRLGQVVAVLQLGRVGLVLTAVADIWLVVFLGRAGAGGPRRAAAHGLPLWGEMLATAAVAVGMYVFGMALNDLMDMRRDRVLAPGKPLPSGRIGPGAAIGLAVGALLLAVAGTLPLGVMSTLLCLVTAAMVLFYNGPGKYITGVGLLTLGLIRASHMLIANPGLGYAWPVWLTMTHVTGLSALCHRLEDKRPRLVGGQIWVVTLGWAFATIVLIGWMHHRGGLTWAERPWLWVGPAAAGVAFLGVVAWTIRGRHDLLDPVRVSPPTGRQAAASQRAVGALLMKRGLMWLIVYDAAWLWSGGLWWHGAVIAALLPATYLLMSAVRLLKALADGPAGFQR